MKMRKPIFAWDGKTILVPATPLPDQPLETAIRKNLASLHGQTYRSVWGRASKRSDVIVTRLVLERLLKSDNPRGMPPLSATGTAKDDIGHVWVFLHECEIDFLLAVGLPTEEPLLFAQLLSALEFVRRAGIALNNRDYQAAVAYMGAAHEASNDPFDLPAARFHLDNEIAGEIDGAQTWLPPSEGSKLH